MTDLEITSPTLRRLYDDWRSRLHGREMPARSDFDILDFKYMLGDLNLLDVERDPLQFRFRVHGTNAVQRVGVDLTGRTVDDYPNPDYRALVRKHYTAVVDTRAPRRVLRERYMLDSKMLRWEGLILPLSDDGQTVNMLMVGLNLSPVQAK